MGFAWFKDKCAHAHLTDLLNLFLIDLVVESCTSDVYSGDIS